MAATAALLFTAAAPGGFCAPDLDGDLSVGFADLSDLLGDWGPCAACRPDLDGDGSVGFADLSALLAGWGPCTFDYGPPRPNAEAEQIGLETLGAAGPLLVPDDVYERVDRDLALIRGAEPRLASETHTPAWLPHQALVQVADGAPLDGYTAQNGYYQVTAEDHLFGEWWLLTFAGNANQRRMAEEYMQLPAVPFAEPNILIGGQNFWAPTDLGGGTWSWFVDDGFHDCFDGCDCHRYYTFEVDAAGTVTLIEYVESGFSWCDWSS